jgi:hypothetical protein
MDRRHITSVDGSPVSSHHTTLLHMTTKDFSLSPFYGLRNLSVNRHLQRTLTFASPRTFLSPFAAAFSGS